MAQIDLVLQRIPESLNGFFDSNLLFSLELVLVFIFVVIRVVGICVRKIRLCDIRLGSA